MSVPSARSADSVVLGAGRLRVEVALRPFAFTIRRGERRLASARWGPGWPTGRSTTSSSSSPRGWWPARSWLPPERALRDRARIARPSGLTLAARAERGDGGRESGGARSGRRPRVVRARARGRAAAPRARLGPARRGALRRARRATRHAARPGRPRRPARRRPPLHRARLPRRDAAPRAACPRATARRCRGCCRVAATGLCARDANGVRFDLAGERISVSTRAPAGPLVLDVFCHPTPAARLRAFCRSTGFPAVLPEWGYGFWKSRDVYEHQDDVLEDYEGLPPPRHTARRDRASTRRGRPSTTPGGSTHSSSPTPTG